MNKVSIILPTYNRIHLLRETLNSIFYQNFENWECIIVDDGSTDNTKEISENWMYIDKRFKYIYQQNAERSAARNHGIENAIGEWICFLDSDDYYLENRLKNLFRKRRNTLRHVCCIDIGEERQRLKYLLMRNLVVENNQL